MPKRHYTVYCDESAKKGRYYSNFYGAALIESRNRQAIEALIKEKKDELNLYKEVKWTKITENYCEKYIALMDMYFDLIASGLIKLRIMFTHNRHVPTGLTDEHRENQYFILYYHLLKHSVGLAHCNPGGIDRISVAVLLDDLPDNNEKRERFKNHLANVSNSPAFRDARVHISRDDIAEVSSNDHVILQGLDVILGAIQFRLNDLHKEKPPGATRRGKRTRAKERVYKQINRRIRAIYPGFNVGESTGTGADLANRWDHPYRHWKFIPSEHDIDESVVKVR